MKSEKNKINFVELFIYIISAELAGALSALLTGGFGGFFIKYREPPLLPPAWLFPVVWTILYAVMGISAYMIKNSQAYEDDIRSALKNYRAQLFVNFSWSIVFFRFEKLWLSAGIIIFLLVLILKMIVDFRKIKIFAGNLNIPYFIWVLFAAYLNIAIAAIN